MRVTVILHERLGNWNRQLRPRLVRHPVRWFESRSPADLEVLLGGLAFPVILIDLARQPVDGLTALELVPRGAPDARPWSSTRRREPDVRGLARELGATHVWSGPVPPPVRGRAGSTAGSPWPGIDIESAGWSRTTFPETAEDPWSWLPDYLLETAEMTAPGPALRRAARASLHR